MISRLIASTGPDGHAAKYGPVWFRRASADDAEQIASLHADSWRRHYRGAYSDLFLDGDVVADRRSVWSARLTATTNSETALAEYDGRMVGFIHVVFDDDPRWGSLVDNLHIVHDQRRKGIGTQLLGHAARAVIERATGDAIYLWVLQQNKLRAAVLPGTRSYVRGGGDGVAARRRPGPAQRHTPQAASGLARRRSAEPPLPGPLNAQMTICLHVPPRAAPLASALVCRHGR